MADIFLIKKPHTSEKAADLKEKRKYVFIVESSANKSEVRKAIKEIYHVETAKVNMVNLPSKPKRFGSLVGRKAGIKKAIVTLKEGQKIEI